MRSFFVAVTLAVATLLPLACADFGASENPDAGPPAVQPEGGAEGGSDGAADAPSPDATADAGRAKTLYVFGGVTIVGQTEQTVFESYAASIREDGSLGSWERAPALDVGRSHMTTIAGPDGLVVIAGGNGVPIGESSLDGYRFFRDDVSTTRGDPPEPWRGSPPLGAGNGRWAAPGTIALGTAYIGGGMVTGGGFTNTVMAAPVTVSPPTVQAWQPAGTLPVAMAGHGLVALGSRLYVIGGSTERDGGTVLSSDTFMTTVAGTSIGAWTAAGNLPKPLKGFGVVGTESLVIAIGGEDGSASVSSSVFIGSQTQNQTLAWQETAPLKKARQHLCVLRANGRFYAIGGASVSAMTQIVEVGELNGSSMTWRETTPMPITRSAFGCAAR